MIFAETCGEHRRGPGRDDPDVHLELTMEWFRTFVSSAQDLLSLVDQPEVR